MILTRAKKVEKGRPLSVAKDQINLDTEANMLTREIYTVTSIMNIRKLVACLFLVA